MSERADSRDICANCGQPLAGEFCFACGQPRRSPIVSLGELLSDFFRDTLSFDSRAWRTVLTLVREPGVMTADYIAGRRHRYSPPVRLYLLTSLLFLAIVTFPLLVDSLTLDINVGELRNAAADGPAQTADGDAGPESVATDAEASGCDDLDINLSENLSGLEEFVRTRAERACRRLSQDGGGKAFARELVDSLPKMLLVLLPVMALVLAVLYPFGRRRYVEHLVLLAHYHSFVFLLVGLTVVLVRLPGLLPASGWIKGLLIAFTSLYTPWYLYRAMRVVYGQGRTLTALKFGALLTAYIAGGSLAFTVGVLLAAESFTR